MAQKSMNCYKIIILKSCSYSFMKMRRTHLPKHFPGLLLQPLAFVVWVALFGFSVWCCRKLTQLPPTVCRALSHRAPRNVRSAKSGYKSILYPFILVHSRMDGTMFWRANTNRSEESYRPYWENNHRSPLCWQWVSGTSYAEGGILYR